MTASIPGFKLWRNQNYRQPVEGELVVAKLGRMHKQKTYHCSVCGAEIPDLPMPVLEHQLSHTKRRPFAGDRAEPDAPPAEDQHQQP